jgi:hypothetical protein
MTHTEFQPYRKLHGNRITNFTNSITGTKCCIQNVCKNNFYSIDFSNSTDDDDGGGDNDDHDGLVIVIVIVAVAVFRAVKNILLEYRFCIH